VSLSTESILERCRNEVAKKIEKKEEEKAIQNEITRSHRQPSTLILTINIIVIVVFVI